MTDIDKILDEVERFTPEYLALRETVKKQNAFPVITEDNRRLLELGPAYRGLCEAAAPALAKEVRRLRAKLVEAAIELAERHYNGLYRYQDAAKEYAERITGIRLKFEDGRFVENVS